MFLRGSKCSVDTEGDWAEIHHKAMAELELNIDDITDFKEEFEDMYLWNKQG